MIVNGSLAGPEIHFELRYQDIQTDIQTDNTALEKLCCLSAGGANKTG